MKITYRFLILLICISLSCIISCTEDNGPALNEDNNSENNDNDNNNQDLSESEIILEYITNLLDVSWDSSIATIQSAYSSDYTSLKKNDKYLCFSHKNGTYLVAFEFYNEELITILLLLKKDIIQHDDIVRLLTDYRNEGEYEGFRIFKNSKTIVTISEVFHDEKSCDALGITRTDTNILTSEFQPFDEIWYTTSDGTICEPYKTDYFNGYIIQNKYESGRGILKFDRDVKTIGSNSFMHCENLESISLPETVQEIEYSAFWGAGIEQIEILSDVISKIGSHAFYGSNLKSFTIPTTIEQLEYRILSETNISNIYIPKNITSIHANAFELCRNLTTIHMESETPPELESNVFRYINSNCKIYVPSQAVDRYKYDPDWKEYAHMIVGAQ